MRIVSLYLLLHNEENVHKCLCANLIIYQTEHTKQTNWGRKL